MPDFKLGWPEFLVVGFVALLLFGKHLPELIRTAVTSIENRIEELQQTREPVLWTLVPLVLTAICVVVWLAVTLGYLRS
jgi:hypothetical protein